MKILFAKIPNSDISNRAIYDKDGFSGLDDNSQTCYGQMFHDSNGEVYALPFSNDELDTEACIFDIEKYFGIDVDFIKEVTIAFFVDTSNGTLLDGWYRHAQIYKYCQPISPVMGRYYIFKTKAIHSVWLPMDIRFKTNLVFKDFVVPNESEARKIMNYISTYSGEKLNIILDEALSRIEIPKIDSVENCVKYCNEMYKSEDISLLNFFKMIKICLQTIEKYGNNEAIYGLLADLYADLGQQELTLKYDKLRCELNPTYENRRFYALSLYCSEEWKKAIPIFSELLDEKSDDEIKMYLADLYYVDGYIQAAYELYNEVKDSSLLDSINIAIKNIKKLLPNISMDKTYRINNNIIKITEAMTYLPIELMPLPHEQFIDGKAYYLDPIRKKPILKTPEEEIRQKAIRYLIDKLDVPEEFIYVRLLHNSKNQVL